RTQPLLYALLLLAARREPRELGRAHQAGRGVDQHETLRPLRIRRRTEHGELAALAGGAGDSAIGPGGVHNRAEGGHAPLKRLVGDPVGHTSTALVEHDQPPQLGQPGEAARDRRVLPAQLDMVGEARDPDQVELAFAHDLEGDVDVAALRILGFWLHRSSVARYTARCESGPRAIVKWVSAVTFYGIGDSCLRSRERSRIRQGFALTG